MPGFLKPSFQRKMAVQAASMGSLIQWVEQPCSEPQLLRENDRRYFGQNPGAVSRQTNVWVRRRGL